MSKNIYRVLIGLLVTVVTPAAAAIGGISSLAALTHDADLIVSGAVDTVQESGDAAIITLKVSRVIKGDTTIAGNTLTIDWNVPPGSFGAGLNHVSTNLPADANGLWFLKRASDTWLVMPVWTGGLSITRTFIPQPVTPLLSAYSYTAEAPLPDRVAAEVCFALENETVGDPPMNMLEGPPLDALQSKYIAILYQHLAASTKAEQYITGLAGQIRSGSATALNAAIDSAAAFSAFPSQNAQLLSSIRNSFRGTDQTSISALGKAVISQTVNQQVRETVAHALAMIHTQAAMPFLATLLGDPDEHLRAEAISGFSLFANGVPIQTPQNTANLEYLQIPATAPYKTSDTVANFAVGELAISQNETQYVAFWKEWWSRHNSEIGVSAQ